MKKTILSVVLLSAMLSPSQAQKKGEGITPDMLTKMEQSYKNDATDKALRNALNATSIDNLARSTEATPIDGHFAIQVKSKGITNQRSSGRCWLFTGLNVMRSQAIEKYDMGEFQFSQVYGFFWDQLEKSNLFLQGVIDTRDKAIDDQMVQWLFKSPINDGGTFAGVADAANKYGLVPIEAMPETYTSVKTSNVNKILKYKLRDFGIQLRKASEKGESLNKLNGLKTEMLGEVYRILALVYGNPPKEFTWVRRDAKGNPVATENHTPMTFVEKYGDNKIINDYVMLMNDPSRPYYELFEIDFDRHQYDGQNWKYINLPMDEIKKIAVAGLKDNKMMYFSSDVGKYFDRQTGINDLKLYDYESLLGITMKMDKKERIESYESGSAHAMTLCGVDFNEKGETTKWLVENSWGADSGHKGFVIMTDDWFNEYMFRLVVEPKYVPEKILNILKKKPSLLPAWDPMFAPEM